MPLKVHLKQKPLGDVSLIVHILHRLTFQGIGEENSPQRWAHHEYSFLFSTECGLNWGTEFAWG